MKFKKNLIISFVISVFILLIATKSSPLYAFNDWCDANAFFTMGKGLFNGKVPFKDLFEQKGPFLYLIYGIGYLISNTNFLGIFILEVISSTIFLYYINEIICLYADENKVYYITPLYALLLYTSFSFTHGGSCEEFCFPMLSYTLYELLKYVKTNTISRKKIYISGFMAGLIFLTKYTILGVSFGYMFYIFFNLVYKKEYKNAITYSLIFLSGMITPIIPWIIYFLINNALYDFINVYILINLFSYTDVKTGIFIKIFNGFIYFYKNICANKYIFIGLFALLLYVIFFKKYYSKEKLSIISTLLFGIIFIYIGGIYFIYYALPLLIFIIFPIIYVCDNIKKLKFNKYIVIPYFIFIITLTYFISSNSKFMKYKKEDLVQYKYSNIILKKENPTILNYGFLDMGFYTMAGITPNTRYFEKLNFNYDNYKENMDSLNYYVDNKLVDFVIYVNEDKEIDYPISNKLDKNYNLIDISHQYFENKSFTYYLYEKIS